MQHWRKQQEVVAANQRHFDVGASSECLVESKRRVHPTEATAEDQYLGFVAHIVTLRNEWVIINIQLKYTRSRLLL